MALAYIFSPRADGKPGAHKDVMALSSHGEWYAVNDGKWGEDVSSFVMSCWTETFEFDRADRFGPWTAEAGQVVWDGWHGGMFEEV